MNYKNPPIQEAIFDLRVDELLVSNIEEIEKIHIQLMSNYPNKRKQINFTGKIDFKEDIANINNEANSQVRGLMFSNAANTSHVQFRLDGFTYNLIKPYSSWDEFSKEAFSLWKIYNENFKPKNLIRIALRYINRIEIPLPVNEFQDYFVNMPPIPGCLPQSFNKFFMQTDVPCDNEGTNIIITETIDLPTKGKLPFILDIDAYKIGIFKNNFGLLNSEFSKLRELKNRTFENCITDKTRQLFN